MALQAVARFPTTLGRTPGNTRGSSPATGPMASTHHLPRTSSLGCSRRWRRHPTTRKSRATRHPALAARAATRTGGGGRPGRGQRGRRQRRR
eukprot:14774405-Alexandrium_andersonii.AAC.1